MKHPQSMSMAEIVAEYNSLTHKSLKRFATRAEAERRLAAARQAQTTTPGQAAAAAAAATPDTEPSPRSAGVRRSWADPEVALDRARRCKVTVDGHPYGSVLQAFQALDLPISKHIKFRAELKRVGRLRFEHAGRSYLFLAA